MLYTMTVPTIPTIPTKLEARLLGVIGAPVLASQTWCLPFILCSVFPDPEGKFLVAEYVYATKSGIVWRGTVPGA